MLAQDAQRKPVAARTMALMGHSIRMKNMRNLMAVLMLAAGLTAMPAHAADITGNKLAEYCA